MLDGMSTIAAVAPDGYTYGSPEHSRSPVSLEELERLKQAVGLGDDDVRALAMAGAVVREQTEDIVASWRLVIGRTPHLAQYYFDTDTGKADETYKARVKERFKQWILDVCLRPYDQAWLDYQHEIGLRHTHLKKNLVDGVRAPPHIPLRYVLAFTGVVNETIKPFLASRGHPAEQVEAMHRAWCKAVLLHVTMWSRAYVSESDW
jgi:hypothetical protein